MNTDESIANKYLSSKYQKLRYEPNGNVPPDFSIDGVIGIEVRRLNQQYRNSCETKGLEEGRIPLIKAFNDELAKYSKSLDGNCYWLALVYEREIGKLKKIRKNIHKAITAFEKGGEHTPFTYNIDKNVTIEFAVKANMISQKYKIGIESDSNSGGWVVPMYIQDITYCIDEKERKVKPYLLKYQSWWLLLVDHIGCAINEDIGEIISGINRPDCFEKILVINALDNKLLFEI